MHEPQGRHQTRIAAASGWIGSALEYYDFFIYATAASLVFPQIFFPSSNPTVAIANVPMIVGALAFGVTVIASIACWSTRETYRIHLKNLGEPGAPSVDKSEYDRLRQQSIASLV
jgi:hypothetical protein